MPLPTALSAKQAHWPCHNGKPRLEGSIPICEGPLTNSGMVFMHNLGGTEKLSKDPLSSLLSRARQKNADFGKHAVFDVGANRGQSFVRLRNLLTGAQIHCFEPVPETFSELEKTVAGDDLAKVRQAALSSKCGRARFTSVHGENNHFVGDGSEATENEIEVEVLTGDQYCQQMGIEEIDFLKIDTEGYDLDVLLGFADMLRRRRVAYLQVECSTNLDNRFHVHLERFIHFLHPFNYRLCDLVDPVRRVHKTSQPLQGIWFCNAIFAREGASPRLRRDGRN